MIADKIQNAHLYLCLSENIAKALEILEGKSLAEKEPGDYHIDGDRLYYLVRHYTTKPVDEAKFETHQKYIDVQFVAKGSEIIGYAPADELTIQTPYNKEKDVTKYQTPRNFTEIKLSAGMFCIFFPTDGHMPTCQWNGPAAVHKVVVKVKLND